jgi:hypothetical protein
MKRAVNTSMLYGEMCLLTSTTFPLPASLTHSLLYTFKSETVSFYVPNASSLTSDRRTVVGYIQIAHRHYEAPRYVPGKLTVIDYDNFSFEWNTTVRKFMRVRTITEEQHHTHTQ